MTKVHCQKKKSFNKKKNQHVNYKTSLSIQGRKQHVLCDGYKSKEICSVSGVTQGGALGPLFIFLLMM